MLSAVAGEAGEAAESGWFWKIRPLRCKVRARARSPRIAQNTACAVRSSTGAHGRRWRGLQARGACAVPPPFLRLAPPQVTSLDAAALGPDGRGHVVATADVSESADLWASNGKQADSYATTYSVGVDACCVAGDWWPCRWGIQQRGGRVQLPARAPTPTSLQPALLATPQSTLAGGVHAGAV